MPAAKRAERLSRATPNRGARRLIRAQAPAARSPARRVRVRRVSHIAAQLSGRAALQSRYTRASMMAFNVGLGRIAFSVFTGSGW